MSEELYNSGRPRRTRSSVYSTATPSTSNPYRKPTYSVGRSNNATPDDSADDASNDTPSTSTPPQRRKPGRPFGSVTKNRSTPGTPRGRGNGRGRGGRGRGGSSGSSRNSDTPNAIPTLTLRKRTSTSGNSSSSTWTAMKGRPECVAHRNDRRSTSNVRGRKKRRGYGTNDYHYGSDFESDQAESELDEAVASESDYEEAAEDEMQNEEPMDSDSSEVSIGPTGSLGLPIPVPIWLDSDTTVEELEIPRSSDDLLLTRSLLVDAIAIYEPIRRFSNLIRLTPFRFEDFCAALVSEEQSSLLAEIHIQLLKALIREDEAVGTCYGPNECKDSIQSVLFFADSMTWAESLRVFMESDPTWVDIYKVLTSVEYPFCGPEVRVQVLGWLIDAFMVGSSVRALLTKEGEIVHEDHCRACNRLGELICCETCPAVYHLACIALKSNDEDPPDDWKCPVCERHELLGVTDCVSEIEKAGLLLRHETLGCDRHGRKYWFLVRRIIVESEDKSEVWYYSTRLQVEELLFRLDGENYEKTLVENILFHKEEIFRQMGVTESITAKMNTNHRKTYLDAENAFLTKIHEERELIRAQELAEKTRIEEEARLAIKKELEEKQRAEEEVRLKKEEEKKKIREQRLAKRNQVKLKQRLGKIVDMDESLEQFLLNDESKDSFTEPDDVGTKDENSEDSKPEDLETNSPILENGDAEVKEEEYNFNEAETQRIDEPPPQLEPEGDETEQKMEVDQEIEVKSEEVDMNTDVKVEEVKMEDVKINAEEVKLEPKDLEPLVKTSILPKIAAKSKSLNLEVDSEERMTRLRSTGFYKLGQEGSFRTYINSYTTDVLALSKVQHSDERDKRRVMSHKFSLTPASECKWSGVTQGLRTSILSTIRQTLLNMEVAIPVTLMHCNWNLLRKSWISAVTGSSDAKDFSKALATFTAGLRPSIFNPVWAEGVGHVTLLRTTLLDKEIRKKNEKRDKKFRDDEEERLKNFPQFVKYTIPPKHMVWKQKGEEFRLHGHYGWIWLSNHRPAKPKDSSKMGLMAGPYKHVIQFKGTAGKVKTMLILPEVYTKLMAKRADSLEQKKVEATPKVESKNADSTEEDVKAVMNNLLDDVVAGREEPTQSSNTEIAETVQSAPKTPGAKQHQESAETKTEKQDASSPKKFRTELINVSLGIVSANRILYPKIAREIPVLDSLLARRVLLQELEEKELLKDFGAAAVEAANGPPPELDKSPIVIKVDAGFPLGGGYSLSCFSYECQKAAKEGKMNYESICYSPMCRLKAVIMNSRRRKVERERQIEFEKRKRARKEILDRRCYNQASTSEKVKLKKLPEEMKNDNQLIVKYPPSPKFVYHRSKKPSILVLPQHDLNQLARSGARKLIPLGFTANPKPNAWLWPYPSGKPLFRTTWQYRTAVQATSLHAAALQLRILYACVRWDDIQMKPLNPEGKSQITTDMEVITSEILNHRIVGRFQEAFQYLRRRHIVPIDAPKTIREVTPSRIGLRKRKRAESPDQSHPEVKEEWVEEEKFEVWEIRLYGEKLERKNEKKPEPPSSSTRTKTGVALKVPEKWDPSPKEKEVTATVTPVSTPVATTPITKFVPVTITSSQPPKSEEPELRIAHPSKRDNHAKITTVNKTPTPTASQQLLLQQQAAAAANQTLNAGNSPTTKVISLTQAITPTGRKFFTTKPGIGSIRGSSVLAAKELPKTGILKKPLISSPLAVGSSHNISNTSLLNSTATPLASTIIRPAQTPQQVSVSNTTTNQKLQIIRTEDGALQVSGLLPGQMAYQTADGNVHVMNSAAASSIMEKKGLTPIPSANTSVPIVRQAATGGQVRMNSNTGIRTAIATVTSTAQNQSPRALVRPAEPRKPAIIKQGVTPTVIRVNRTAEDLKTSPLHLQIGRNTIEVKHQDIVKNAAGEDQIHLGPGLPIIQLLPAPLPENTAEQSQMLESTYAEPPPLQHVQPTASVHQPEQISVTPVGGVPAPAIQSQNVAQVAATQSPTIMAAGSKIMYNEGNRSFVLNTTGYTEAQVQALVQQLQERKIVIKGTETASLQQQVQQQQQIILPQGLLQGQVLLQQQPQQQQVFVQAPQNTVVTNVATGTQLTQRMVTFAGGQKVFLTRAPTQTVTQQRTITPVGGHPQVFQRVVVPASSVGMTFSSPKTIISVTPPVTQVNYRPTATATQQRQITPSTPTAVTRTPLPISIVSPSKPRLIQQTTSPIRITPPNQVTLNTATSAATTTTTSPVSAGHPGIMTSQQLTGLLQQRQVTAISTPAPLASVRIPTAPASSPTKTQFVQLQTSTMNQNVGSASRLPTILRPVTPVASPTKPKVIAQVVQTPEGPCLKVQGIPANISPQMLAHLDAQLSKQVPGILRKDGLGSILAAAGIQVTPSTGGGISLSTAATPSTVAMTPTIRPRLLIPAKKNLVKSPRAPRPIAAAPVSEQHNTAEIGSIQQNTVEIGSIQQNTAEIGSIQQNTVDGGVIGSTMMEDFGTVETMGVAEEVTISSTGNNAVAKRPRTVSGELRTRSPSPKKRKVNDIPVTSFSQLPAVSASAPEKILATPPHEYEESEAEARFVLTQDLVESGPEPIGVPEMAGEEVLTSVAPGDESAGPPLNIMASPSSASESSSPTAPPTSTHNSLRLSPDIIAGNPPIETQQASAPLPVPAISTPAPKTTRRKSDGAGQAGKSATAAFQKSLQSLYKHKELLKKDLAKKRDLLDKELLIEIRAEIMEELKSQEDLSEESPEADKKAPKPNSSEKRPVMKTSKGRASLPVSGKAGKARKAKSRKKEAELFCTCQKPYDRNKFYVGCDKCDKWYHGECVGITEEMSRILPEYICLECQNPVPVQLYCICKQPYDESQFYIACDKCDDWLHGRCVGILPIEGDKMDQFVCKTCDPMTALNRLNAQSLRPDDFDHLEKLVKQIKSHKSATPFRKPVDASVAPNYFRVIKDPMDLCEVERRVEQRRYTRLPEFIRDMSLIFENCRYFNQPESQFFKSANILEGFFAQKIKVLRQQLLAS